VDQVGEKEEGIKDFDPGHSSCPLIDLIACFVGVMVSKSGLYCQPLEVSKEGYSDAGLAPVCFLSRACAVPIFWAAAPFPFAEILSMAWGSDCQ